MTKQGVFDYYTVDKLKVCYKITPKTYNNLIQKDTTLWKYSANEGALSNNNPNWDFELIRIKDYRLRFELRIKDSTDYFIFGYLRLNPNIEEFERDKQSGEKSKDDFANYCFVEVDNRIFYEPLETFSEVIEFKKSRKQTKSIDTSTISYSMPNSTESIPKVIKKHQYNSVFMLIQIAQFLNIELYSISNLEISYDSNTNYGKLIKSSFLSDTLIPVVNNKRYPSLRSANRITGIIYQYSATRRNCVDMTLYVKHKKDDLQLKCYCKSREIAANDNVKSYINERYSKKCEIFRSEITAKKKYIHKYCVDNRISLDEFLFNLSFEEKIRNPFIYWANMLIHFNVKKSDTQCSIFDLRTHKV